MDIKKRYFVWKDGKRVGGKKQEWTEISGKEFLKIRDEGKGYAANQRRHFLCVPGVESDDTQFYFECDYKRYKKYRAEKEQNARRAKKQKVQGKKKLKEQNFLIF